MIKTNKQTITAVRDQKSEHLQVSNPSVPSAYTTVLLINPGYEPTPGVCSTWCLLHKLRSAFIHYRIF